jgi:hypothetical protein
MHIPSLVTYAHPSALSVLSSMVPIVKEKNLDDLKSMAE